MKRIKSLNLLRRYRAGRADRRGASVSTIVTYNENRPHDSWYFNNPGEIIAGEPRMPWVDSDNKKLIYRHINMIFLREYFLLEGVSLDCKEVASFFDKDGSVSMSSFLLWLQSLWPYLNAG